MLFFILMRQSWQSNFSTAGRWHDRGHSKTIMTKHSLLVESGSQLGPERLNGASQRGWDIPYNEYWSILGKRTDTALCNSYYLVNVERCGGFRNVSH